MWNIDAPVGVFLVRFSQNLFRDALAVKISFDLLNGLWSYGGFKLTVSGCMQIFSVS